MQDEKPRLTPAALLVVVLIAAAVLAAIIDKGILALVHQHPSGPFARSVDGYLHARARLVAWWPVVVVVAVFAVGIVFVGLKKLSAHLYRIREEAAGFAFKNEGYHLERREFSLKDGIEQNPNPQGQIFLGVDANGQRVYLTDRARSMHLHVLGQTGSGKTKSVIEPLIFQDLRRRRGVCVVDGKGSQDNEERLLAMAALAGRLPDVRLFTLNPYRKTHTYNPVHMPAKGDPRAIAERVFSTFTEDMDNPYYRDQAQPPSRKATPPRGVASTARRAATSRGSARPQLAPCLETSGQRISALHAHVPRSERTALRRR